WPARGRDVGREAGGDGKRRAGNRRATGLSRRQPRLSRGDVRRHPVARAGAGGRKHPAGRVGVAPSAARGLPRAQRMSLRGNDIGGEDDDEAAYLFPPRRAQRLGRHCGIGRVRVGYVGGPARALVPATAGPPLAGAVTQQLTAAAKKEGRVVYYTSIDLPVAERIAKAFEAKYSGIDVRVERSGAERVFQRIGQEYASRIHSVDV